MIRAFHALCPGELVVEVDQLLAGVDVEFLVDAFGMAASGVFRDEELAGDGRYRVALHEQLGHLDLAWGEAALFKVAVDAALLLGGAVAGRRAGFCVGGSIQRAWLAFGAGCAVFGRGGVVPAIAPSPP